MTTTKPLRAGDVNRERKAEVEPTYDSGCGVGNEGRSGFVFIGDFTRRFIGRDGMPSHLILLGVTGFEMPTWDAFDQAGKIGKNTVLNKALRGATIAESDAAQQAHPSHGKSWQ